ncbi:mitochondrial genome maintenance MGM101-domain-containing protein [Echria macrotheca]|uniref:Mitochondrial genome maintenance protein MGM101 n=1 Tax=Echria macrotheca TaxID=438768 RepID=A0AAJ0FA88_9PEZI|nr:mitochondrial genome maintenance MGM101-domain-containing protein [Echria macrotheca]
MRSRALQLVRPVRPTPPSLRPYPLCLTIARTAATSATATPKRTPANTSARPSARPRLNSTGVKLGISRELSESQIDPQAAVPPSVSASEVDVDLAATIPTPTSPASGAFASALGGPSSTPSTSNGESNAPIDWSSSFHGLSTTPFSPEAAAILLKDINPLDVEIKPDGIIYMPEIKYRRILNAAFGPGGWGLAPRGELVVGERVVTREFALIVHGRFVAIARGECAYFSEETIPTAGEGCKSNALMRCCKDIGIASELWDPRFIREFKKTQCEEVWVEHVVNKKRRQIWKLKDGSVEYPYREVKR